jgi:uncharacterized protein involved in exopolysaccharide biosynthesis
VLEQINDFNLRTRQSQAATERRFTERRLAEVRQDLRDAENEVKAFLGHNASYDRAPQLKLEYDRLSREVSLRQQVYTSLSEAYEQAKIDEVRDTPVLTVIEAPTLPVSPDPRGLLRRAVFASIIAAFLTIAVASLRELVRGWDNRTPELVEFRTLKREALADLRNPVRPLARAFSRKRIL